MAKKPFEWKETQQVGIVPQNEKKQYMVQFNSLDVELRDDEGEVYDTEERWYVSITTMQFFKKKDDAEAMWHITKNATFPFEQWFAIKALIEANVE